MKEICLINGRGKNFSNISVQEREAVENLKRYEDIVIKEADKGSAMVIWESYMGELYGRVIWEDYGKETFDQLWFSDVYERILNNPLDRVSSLFAQNLDLPMRKGKLMMRIGSISLIRGQD